jgi:hypothetical protein
MSKTVLAVGSMTSALLLACMAAVLTATPSASQTQTVTLVGAGDIAECSPDNNAKTTAALLAKYLQVNIESPRLPADADRAIRPASIQLPSRRMGVASGNL